MTAVRNRRAAALRAIQRFCAHEGFAVPTLRPERRGRAIMLIGAAPDGREFGIGYVVRA